MDSRTPQCIHHRLSFRGYTLIELLITLVITSISFLGIAGMQSLNLQHTQQSWFRTRANLLLHDMAIRMHSNPEAALSGDYLHEGWAQAADNTVCNGATFQCTVQQLAAADIAEWGKQISDTGGLPGGRSSIAAVAADGTFRLTVSWMENTNNRQPQAAENSQCQDADEIRRTCLSMMVYISE